MKLLPLLLLLLCTPAPKEDWRTFELNGKHYIGNVETGVVREAKK